MDSLVILVPSFSRLQHYKFGESVSIKFKALKQHVHDLIERLHKAGPLYLVFHDPSQDIKYVSHTSRY